METQQHSNGKSELHVLWPKTMNARRTSKESMERMTWAWEWMHKNAHNIDLNQTSDVIANIVNMALKKEFGVGMDSTLRYPLIRAFREGKTTLDMRAAVTKRRQRRVDTRAIQKRQPSTSADEQKEVISAKSKPVAPPKKDEKEPTLSRLPRDVQNAAQSLKSICEANDLTVRIDFYKLVKLV